MIYAVCSCIHNTHIYIYIVNDFRDHRIKKKPADAANCWVCHYAKPKKQPEEQRETERSSPKTFFLMHTHKRNMAQNWVVQCMDFFCVLFYKWILLLLSFERASEWEYRTFSLKIHYTVHSIEYLIFWLYSSIARFTGQYSPFQNT